MFLWDGTRVETLGKSGYRWRTAGSRTIQQRITYQIVTQPRHKTLVLEHRLSICNRESLCLPCCARYLPYLPPALTQVSISAVPNMPTTMSSNNSQATGVKVSPFLRDEKRSCKELQKKILSKSHRISAMQVAQTADKSHRGHATRHTPRQKLHHPSRAQRSKNWRPLGHCQSPLEGKRSGEVFQGHLSGPATHSLLLALAGLREKAQEMVRAAKCQSRHQGRATKKSDVVVGGDEVAQRGAERESMFMLPGLAFSGFEIPLRDRRWSFDRT